MNLHIDQNKKVYNKIAKHFSATRKFLWDDLKPLAKYTKNGDKVLDIGCGNGRLYQLFSDLSIDYVGLDNSEGQIEMARKNYPKAKFIIAEMTALPFDENSFDVIYCIAAFHHLPDEETRLQALAEMKRVLKSGGYILMTNWNLYSDSAQKTVKKGKWSQEAGEFMVPWYNSQREILGQRYYHGFTLGELEDLFKKTGLVLEDQFYSRKGERGEIDDPGNIVSILSRK
ncbi:MAG: class I SAM-dependent methyltransferase [Patescibacteria group bacterium]